MGHSDYFESEYKDSVCENLKNKEKLVPNIPENYADGTCFLVKKWIWARLYCDENGNTFEIL